MSSEEDSSIAFNEKTFLIAFIGSYRAERCLWDSSSPHYNDKEARKQGINKMLDVMRAFIPDAERLDVKRKINTLRHAYRRELLEKEAKNGQTSLWYFNLLNFLRVKSGGIVENKVENEDPLAPKPMRRKASETSSNEVETPPKFTKKVTSPIEVSPKTAETNSVHFNALATIWENKLHNMSRLQRLFAEKAVNEILLHGELGLLTKETVIKVSSILQIPVENSIIL